MLKYKCKLCLTNILDSTEKVELEINFLHTPLHTGTEVCRDLFSQEKKKVITNLPSRQYNTIFVVTEGTENSLSSWMPYCKGHSYFYTWNLFGNSQFSPLLLKNVTRPFVSWKKKWCKEEHDKNSVISLNIFTFCVKRKNDKNFVVFLVDFFPSFLATPIKNHKVNFQ